MARDPEARSLVLQSTALEARATLLLDQLIDHTQWLQRVVASMEQGYVREVPGPLDPYASERSQPSESPANEPMDNP